MSGDGVNETMMATRFSKVVFTPSRDPWATQQNLSSNELTLRGSPVTVPRHDPTTSKFWAIFPNVHYTPLPYGSPRKIFFSKIGGFHVGGACIWEKTKKWMDQEGLGKLLDERAMVDAWMDKGVQC